MAQKKFNKCVDWNRIRRRRRKYKGGNSLRQFQLKGSTPMSGTGNHLQKLPGNFEFYEKEHEKNNVKNKK